MLVWLHHGIDVTKADATLELETTELDTKGTTVATAASNVLTR
jgi:hypothetical protein